MRLLIWKFCLLATIISILLNPTHIYSKTILTTNCSRSYPIDNSCIRQFESNYLKNLRERFIDSEEIGNQEVFWTINAENNLYVQKRATLLSIGEYCYVYYENATILEIGQELAINISDFYRDEFDKIIYDKNVELMGSPDGQLGDVDGDSRVTIFLCSLNGYGGVYLEDDLPDNMYANNREMVHIDTSFGKTKEGLITLMHEFNHLIFFNNDLNEGSFILEGVADFSMLYAGYLSARNNKPAINLTYETNDFLTNHQQSLLSTHQNNNGFPLLADYGKTYLYVFYLVEKFGIDLLTNLVLAPPDGPLGIDYALNETGYDVKFNEIFLNWITACTIDEESYGKGIYGFKNLNYVVNPDNILFDYPYQKSEVKHYPYGFHVKKLLDPPDNFTFIITNPYPTYSLGISIAINDQNGWQVIQSNLLIENKTIEIYFTGSNIKEAYIITSLMSKNTPKTFIERLIIGNEPYLVLNYSIVPGHPQTATTKSNSFSITITLIFIFSSINIVIISSKKIKKY